MDRLDQKVDCPGTQSDVSIWKDLVFVSVDSARGARFSWKSFVRIGAGSPFGVQSGCVMRMLWRPSFIKIEQVPVLNGSSSAKVSHP